MTQQPIYETIESFLKKESASGIILMFMAVLAIVAANSPFANLYITLLDTPVEIRIGALHLAKPLLLWINDGLMAVFFFLVGLELKREIIEGELSDIRNVMLPLFAAFGGMIFPALIYIYFNYGDAAALKGWAIPAATDIAFALGILALLGSKVPASLKVFLVSLAIIDDIGAIVIIALFYTSELSVSSLLFATFSILFLVLLNIRKVTNTVPYILVGIVLWVAVLKSGVHATLAGVVLAFCIPLKTKCEDTGISPAKKLEHDLHGSVSFVILPLFAFANAGLDLSGLSMNQMLSSVPLGIALGLLLGKPLGIMLFSFLAVTLGLARLPDGFSWKIMLGMGLLAGVGFTMSLFIGSLAFEQGGGNVYNDRLGILMGSITSGVLGYLLLNASLSVKKI